MILTNSVKTLATQNGWLMIGDASSSTTKILKAGIQIIEKNNPFRK